MLNIFNCCTKFSNKNKKEIYIKKIKILPEYKKLVHLQNLKKIQKLSKI